MLAFFRTGRYNLIAFYILPKGIFMYSFANDYSEGAHPLILQALSETNFKQTCGYGLDGYCAAAADTIRSLCSAPEADVHFVVGGTQANLLTIHAFLRSYEAVIAAHTGHVNVHETGAIELTGHKVVALPSSDGKVTPAMVEEAVAAHCSEHMVHPRLIYISNTTEVGTLYRKAELAALRRCCDDHGLFLYLDGARLGSALTAPGNDLTWSDLSRYTDAFTIGGTKNGALFGEAVVLVQKSVKDYFRYYMKQRGAMLAKGRLLGVQFQALLKDGLYLQLAQRANEQAARLREGISALGYELSYHSPSNQIFPVFPNHVAERLASSYDFTVDALVGPDRTRVRLVTSWATEARDVDRFLEDLARMQ